MDLYNKVKYLYQEGSIGLLIRYLMDTYGYDHLKYQEMGEDIEIVKPYFRNQYHIIFKLCADGTIMYVPELNYKKFEIFINILYRKEVIKNHI